MGIVVGAWVVAACVAFAVWATLAERARIRRRRTVLASRPRWTSAELAAGVGDSTLARPRLEEASGALFDAFEHTFGAEVDCARVRPDDRLNDDLWIDGPGWISDLTLTMVVQRLEQRLAIQIRDAEFENIRTVGDLVLRVASLRGVARS